MSKYRLELFFFFSPVKEIRNSNEFFYCVQAAGQVCFPAPGLGVKWFYLWGTWNVAPWVYGDVSPVFTKRLTGSGSSGKQRWRARKTWGKSSVQKMGLAAQCVCPALCQASRRHWMHLLLLLFSRLVVSNTFQPHELQCIRLPCPSAASKVWLFFEASDFTFLTTVTVESHFCSGPAASFFLGLLAVLLLSPQEHLDTSEPEGHIFQFSHHCVLLYSSSGSLSKHTGAGCHFLL